MSELEINLIDKYEDVLQINKEVILKKDIKGLAKEHNLTKKTLLKILNERGFEYDRKQKGYICIKSATKGLEMASATLEDTVEKFIVMQLELNKRLLEQSHSATTSDNTEEIIDVEANYVPEQDWDYVKKSLKVDKDISDEYDRLCEKEFKGLKKQEVTTIMMKQFIQQHNK